jgi:hypothetical protein
MIMIMTICMITNSNITSYSDHSCVWQAVAPYRSVLSEMDVMLGTVDVGGAVGLAHFCGRLQETMQPYVAGTFGEDGQRVVNPKKMKSDWFGQLLGAGWGNCRFHRQVSAVYTYLL